MSHSDLYQRKGSLALRNKLEETDPNVLRKRERLKVATKSATLVYAMQSQGTDTYFDMDRLQFISQHLYGDVYDEDIIGRRTEPVDPYYDNAEHYLSPDMADEILDDVHARLIAADWFDERDPEDERSFHKTFSVIMAKTYSEIVRARPFKEKNELPALLFVSQMAAEAGYELDLSNVSPARFHEATSDAVKGNVGRLQVLFSNIGKPTEAAFEVESVEPKKFGHFVDKLRSESTDKIFDDFHFKNDSAHCIDNYLDHRHIEVKGRVHRDASLN